MNEQGDAMNQQELGRKLRRIANREIQLWSIGAVVMAVLALAFLGMVAPNLMWKSEPVRLDNRYLPQLFFGFLALLVLFNLYVFEQKRKLDRLREQLTVHLVSDPQERSFAADPQTNVFTWEFGDQMLIKEAKRAERLHAPLTVLAAAIQGVPEIRKKHGAMAGDHLLLVAANMLKSTFRGTDTVSRFAKEEFVVVMPDTSLEQAEHAVSRLRRAIDSWNNTTEFAYELDLRLGRACYYGGDVQQTTQAAVEDCRKQQALTAVS